MKSKQPIYSINKTEKYNIIKALEQLLSVYAIEDKRQIFWALLYDSISGDTEGVEWMYYRLEEFIRKEFDRIPPIKRRREKY